MKSTTTNPNQPPKKKEGGFSKFLKNVFGGEFLLSSQMRPWYPYILFVLLLMAILIVSEQRIQEKRVKVTKLENEYKAEISRLKANNQFIPYEENQILIHKMQERGYVLDEEHNYTIKVTKEVPDKKHHFFSFFKRNESKQR